MVARLALKPGIKEIIFYWSLLDIEFYSCLSVVLLQRVIRAV